MRFKRLLSWILTLCLLVSSLSAMAEGSDDSAAAQAESDNALQIAVEYDEENAEWDGRLQARVKVSWDSTDGAAAEDVVVYIQTTDGLSLSQGDYELDLGDIEAGSAVYFGIELAYDSSHEQADYVPEPTLKITAVGSGTGYAVYTCRLDGTTEPRVLLIGWEESDVGPRAVQTDLRLMKGIFSESYYNGQSLDIEAYFNGRPLDADPALSTAEPFESLLRRVEQWEEDANDVTYLYINAHGAMIDDVSISAFFAQTEKDSVWIGDREITGGGIVTYRDLLEYLDEHCKGRVVIITDICFSGKLILAAVELDLSSEKYSILTSTNWDLPSKLWPDIGDLNRDNEDPLIDIPGISLPYSYGWYTNDLCDLLDAGFAENEDGVVTAYNAHMYLRDVGTKIVDHFTAALNNIDKDTFSPDNFSGLDDIIDSLSDEWIDRLALCLRDYEQTYLLFLNKMDPLDILQQALVLLAHLINPSFIGNCDTLLYCDNPEYDDGKRLLTVVEESVEYMSALEMYYAYLREQILPKIGLARRDDLITDERRTQAAFWRDHWADIAYDQAVSGLLSAVVCDLDKNGSLDMITLTIAPCSKEQINRTGYYFSVNLTLYQISNGRVVGCDSRDNILFVNKNNVGIWSHMRCWMLEFEDQISFRASCFSSAGNSDEWVHSFSCTFRDGQIIDGAENPYRQNHVIQTEEGLPYSYSNWGYGYYDHMGEGVAFIEFVGEHRGDLYNAFDYTSLYEYIYGYAQPEVFVPLKLVAVPIGALPDEVKTPLDRRNEVNSGIDSAIEAAMNAAGMDAYPYAVACDTETGEATQLILYSNLADYGAIDTETLRSMALAALESPEVAAPEEAVSAMRNFEFSKKSPVEVRAGNCRIQFMTIPDGSYVLVLDVNQ